MNDRELHTTVLRRLEQDAHQFDSPLVKVVAERLSAPELLHLLWTKIEQLAPTTTTTYFSSSQAAGFANLLLRVVDKLESDSPPTRPQHRASRKRIAELSRQLANAIQNDPDTPHFIDWMNAHRTAELMNEGYSWSELKLTDKQSRAINDFDLVELLRKLASEAESLGNLPVLGRESENRDTLFMVRKLDEYLRTTYGRPCRELNATATNAALGLELPLDGRKVKDITL